ncbi:sugar ABC transporter permease [Nocardioides mesophilus]|uniref:Xylose transport system permease protein XylH n=1 Tax=Nocardioides mesophilus TaxID=433659 RepID=A0A7G9RFL6_9ACTN|nr:sugar ABC transporter permease [Nocardioides mesophilus]
MIAVGVVVILLLGEIDLSVAAISGFCGAVLGVLNVQLGWNAWLSVAVAVLVGIAIGIFQGSVVTYFRVPAFVITLAGLIGLQGWTLALFGDRTAINFDYAGDVAKLTSTFLSPVAGWGIAAAIILAVAYFNLKERARLKAAGLEHSELRTQILKIVGIALVLCGAIVVFNRDRGLPLAVFIFLAIVVAMDYVIRQTRYGSRLLAIGGNAEAARRAGIPVQRIRIAAFAIGSGLAAFGGVLAASRLIAATTQSGAGDTLINAIAAAVIGGTSLFGGRGSVYSALVGVLIIGSISNGMDLLALPSAAKFIITSMVLLLAVVVDAIAARSSRSQVRE